MTNSLEEQKTKLFNRNFTLLFGAKLISQLGDTVYSFAIALFILELTGSAIMMSSYLAVGTITYLVLAPIGGVLADRLNKVKIMYLTDILQSIMIAIVGVAVFSDVSKNIIIVLLFLSAIVLNGCLAVFTPTSMSLIPIIVGRDNLTKANSLSQGINQAVQILGLFIGGIVYGLVGAVGVFFITSITNMLAALLEMFVRYQYVKPEKIQHKHSIIKGFFKEILEGFRYIRDDKYLYNLVRLIIFTNLVFAPLFSVFLTYTFKQLLGYNEIQLSYIRIAMSAGYVIGTGIISFIKYEHRFYSILTGSLIFMWLSIGLIPIGLALRLEGVISSQVFLLVMIINIFFNGLANACCNIPFFVVVQKRVEQSVMGRVSALIQTAAMLATPIGMIVGGFAADRFSMVSVISVQFLLIGMVVLATLFNKVLKSPNAVEKEIRENACVEN